MGHSSAEIDAKIAKEREALSRIKAQLKSKDLTPAQVAKLKKDAVQIVKRIKQLEAQKQNLSKNEETLAAHNGKEDINEADIEALVDELVPDDVIENSAGINAFGEEEGLPPPKNDAKEFAIP